MVAGLLPLPLTLSLPHHLRFVFNIVAVLSDVTLVFLTICSASLTLLQCFQISLFLTIRNASLTLLQCFQMSLFLPICGASLTLLQYFQVSSPPDTKDVIAQISLQATCVRTQVAGAHFCRLRAPSFFHSPQASESWPCTAVAVKCA